jgi:hypothetical protein
MCSIPLLLFPAAVFEPEIPLHGTAFSRLAHPVEHSPGGHRKAAGFVFGEHFNRVAGFHLERIACRDCRLGEHEVRVLHRGEAVGDVVFRLGVEG